MDHKNHFVHVYRLLKYLQFFLMITHYFTTGCACNQLFRIRLTMIIVALLEWLPYFNYLKDINQHVA